jgi:hypothetical protein
MVIMEIIVAYADYQLSFYRNMIYIGMLSGILMKLNTLDTKEEKLSHEATRTHAEFPIPYMGSRHT